MPGDYVNTYRSRTEVAVSISNIIASLIAVARPTTHRYVIYMPRIDICPCPSDTLGYTILPTGGN